MLDIDKIIEGCEKQLAFLSSKGIQHAFVSINVSITSEITLFPGSEINHAYWSRPDEEYSAIGLGKLFYLTAEGENRLNHLEQNYLQYCQQWQAPPTAYMAFAFDAEDAMSDEWAALPNAFLCVPRLLIESKQGSNSISFNIDVNADLRSQLDSFTSLLEEYSAYLPTKTENDDRVVCLSDDAVNKEHWFHAAEKAIDAIRQRQFRKLVVSRRYLCEAKPSFDTRLLLSALAERYPDCTIISYVDNASQFIAVSPERLLSLHAGQVQSDAIGGTLTEEELKQSITDDENHPVLSPKLMEEHAIIVEDICSRLEPVCQTLCLPPVPQLRKLRNIYHLETPVSGRLTSRQTVLSLTERLHPTPAIAGFPSRESVNWIRENEKHKRGWYAGAFSLMSGDQSGEVSVLLRCALVNQTRINVYAGAGLVAESDVNMEWQETELKLNAILDLL